VEKLLFSEVERPLWNTITSRMLSSSPTGAQSTTMSGFVTKPSRQGRRGVPSCGIQAKTEGEMASGEELDDLKMDLERESERRVRIKLSSHDLKHYESDEPPTECAVVPGPAPECLWSIGICKPKKCIGVDINPLVDMKYPNYSVDKVLLKWIAK
jgi:hypothetical protein